jgi:glycine/D-amino acid oxidase-like deaminating enzyme
MRLEPLWLAELKDQPPLGTSLERDINVDVAIAGGGFVGLWTSIFLKEQNPDLKVAVIEQGRVGQGASSRNGGFVMSWWPKIASLVEAAGKEDGLWLADQTTSNVQELGDFLTEHQVDAEFVNAGWLWTATSEAHFKAWESVLLTAKSLGYGHIFEEVSYDDLVKRTGSRHHLRGIFERLNGNVHPGKLAYGLGTIAKRLGVKIYEDQPVARIDRSAPIVVHTPSARVTADRLVIATNAWARSLPEVHKRLICVSSAIVATPPIPSRLAELGWTGGETITDSQSTLNYYRTTRSGRIVYGKGWANLQYGKQVRDEVFSDRQGIEEAAKDFRRMYPTLGDIELEFGWSGPIDRTYDGLPIISRLEGSPHISFGVGWSGNGVGPSRLGGRILASLATGVENRWTTNRFVNRKGNAFPPEPIRYIAGSIVRAAVVRKDKAEISGKVPSALDRKLASFAPAGTEDKR